MEMPDFNGIVPGTGTASSNGSANESSVVAPTAAAFSPETVTLAGSGLSFINTYDASVGADYHTAILFAEHDLESHFTNSVTIRVNFGFAIAVAHYGLIKTHRRISSLTS